MMTLYVFGNSVSNGSIVNTGSIVKSLIGMMMVWNMYVASVGCNDTGKKGDIPVVLSEYAENFSMFVSA